MWVKVCGITREQDGRLAAELGASAIGFVFWPGSRRFVRPEEARRIASRLPADLLRVGVFVNQSVAEVAVVAAWVGLGAVQLHGEEVPADFVEVGARLIKAVPLGEGAPNVSLAEVPPDVLVLVEGAGPAVRGGSGSLADWSRAADIASRRQIILAGGLTPENVASAVARVRPFGVDVSSGVEVGPGVKDPDLLRRFMVAASSAFRARVETAPSTVRGSTGSPRTVISGKFPFVLSSSKDEQRGPGRSLHRPFSGKE